MEEAEAIQEAGQEPVQEKPKTGKGSGRGSHNKGKKWGVQAPLDERVTADHESTDDGTLSVSADEDGAGVGGAKEQLADMRHVYTRPPKEDTTQGHRTCRKWLRDDPRGFMTTKSRLEEKTLDRVREEEEAPDKGSARCVELCERLLRQWAEELR